jgi:hypothetical protein
MATPKFVIASSVSGAGVPASAMLLMQVEQATAETENDRRSTAAQADPSCRAAIQEDRPCDSSTVETIGHLGYSIDHSVAWMPVQGRPSGLFALMWIPSGVVIVIMELCYAAAHLIRGWRDRKNSSSDASQP